MAVLIIGLCLVALLFTGCCLFDVHILDGPGMVNYNGILLDALIGIWNSDDGSYRLTVWDNYTLNGIPFVPQKLRNFPAILEHRKIQANPL